MQEKIEPSRKSQAERPAKISHIDLSPDEEAPELLATGPTVIPAENLPALLKNPLGYRTLMWIALPSFAEQIINGVIATVDRVVAGHGGSEAENAAASAAVGAMTYLQWFCGLMASAVGVGATALVSRSIGARRVRMAQRVAGTAITAAFLVGIALSLFLYFAAPIIVRGFSLQGQAYENGITYLRIMAYTICFQTIGGIGQACLRGAGDLVKPMLIAASIMIVNLITVPALSYGLYGLPAMGIKGNAIGTLIAYCISGVATISILISGRAKLTLTLRHFRILPHILQRIMRISLPSWTEGVLLWGGQYLIVFFVNAMNDKALAKAYDQNIENISGLTMSVHSTVLQVEMFAFLPGFGIGMATAALVGQSLGAKRPDLARRAAFLSTRLALITMTILALPMVFLPTLMMKLMVSNSHAAEIGFWPMILAGLAQPGFAIAIIMASALKGAGDTYSVMVSTLLGMFAVRIPIVFGIIWLFNAMGHPTWGLTAVWITIFIDLNFRAVYNTMLFKRGKWALKKV